MNTQEAKLAKVRKSCKTAKVVTKVISILLLVATILCIAGAGLVYVNADKINEVVAENQANITFEHPDSNGIVQFDINERAMLEEGAYAEVITLYCVLGAVICLFTMIIFRAISKAFVLIEESESPFQSEVLRKLKRTFIGLTIVTGLFVGIGTCVMLGLILWCIYCIMDYGAALQEEVDEIL